MNPLDILLVAWIAVAVGVVMALVAAWHRRATERRWRAFLDGEKQWREAVHALQQEHHAVVRAHLDDLREALRDAREQLAKERDRIVPDPYAVARLLTTGSPVERPAESFEVVEPEVRARAALTEEAIKRGIADLRTAYEASALTVPSDEELRREVEDIMLGNSPAARP